MADNVAEESAGLPALAVTAAVGAVVLLLVLLCGVGQGKGQQEEEKTEEKNSKVKKQPRKAKPKPAPKQRPGTHTFSHTLLSTSLKGHSGRVMGLDFSNNAKYLATCAEDRTVRIWSLKDWKDKEHKSVQVNVELDHATSVKFSPDNRAFIVALYNGNTIRVFRIGRKDEGTGIHVSALEQDFPQKSIKDIVGLGISSNGKFMMTAFADTSIYVWNTKPGDPGEVLATIDTHQMENYHAAVSPCGRFIGCSGFTPDVKVWEVSFTKGGEFNQVSRAFELKGHSSGVYSFDFNVDSSRMVSVSKDGTWRLWDTNIEYEKGQEASLLSKGDLHSSAHCMVAMAPNGSSFAIAQGYDISLYSTETGQEEEKFTDVHAEPVTAVAFDLGSKYLVSAGDKHVRVLHNTVGYRALLHDLQHKLKTTQSTAYKERLKEQIKETEDALKSIVGEEKGEKDKKDKENSKKKGK